MKTVKTIQSAAQGVFDDNFTNDCSVRALANATGMTYQEAFSIMKENGRKDNEGAFIQSILSAYKSVGFRPALLFKAINIGWNAAVLCGKKSTAVTFGVNRKITLKKFLDKLPENYKKIPMAIVINGHIVACVNGQLVDTFDNNARAYVAAVLVDKCTEMAENITVDFSYLENI